MKRIIALVPFIALAACHHKEATLTKTVTPVRVAAVDTYQPKGGGRYSATILPGRQVTLSFRVAGLVQSIHQAYGRGLEPGDIVAAGTVLANVREEDYRHNTAQAQSQLPVITVPMNRADPFHERDATGWQLIDVRSGRPTLSYNLYNNENRVVGPNAKGNPEDRQYTARTTPPQKHY